MKLGSLFDGSGGFPLAGSLCGIEPVWAAEVEPYPIAVTRSRFPNMRHLGDISKVNGAEIEPVDIITFGSPCQDLSVAGKQAGIKHKQAGDEETTRSGLFMEAVRIIKEMREATNGEYPRFALWENVPGAFSSNKGDDFRIVCEELIKIIEPTAVMPGVPEKGWAYADSYRGDGWSLAYRVFDAQYWGVPQRRRRIHLVVDFRGLCAQAILFEREGVRGYFAEGRTPWQGIAGDAEDCPGADDRAGEGFDGYNGELTGEVASTLGVNCGVSTGKNGVIQRGRQLDAVIRDAASFIPETGGGDPRRSVAFAKEIAPCLRAGFTPAVSFHLTQDPVTCEDKTPCISSGSSTHGQATVGVALSFEPGAVRRLGGHVWEEVAGTLRAEAGDNRLPACYVLDDQGGQQISVRTDGKAPTLRAEAHGNLPCVMSPVCYNGENITSPLNKTNPQPGEPCHTLGTDSRNYIVFAQNQREEVRDLNDKAVALNAQPGTHQQTFVAELEPHYIVRRLTPGECARLQGFADWWSVVEQKDSLTAEEYAFWLEVRNTHAAINGKVVKDYTEAQMLTWYNKLWTDGAEYKMWGNGIALPPALYCMQGIVEAMNPEEGDDDWMF